MTGDDKTVPASGGFVRFGAKHRATAVARERAFSGNGQVGLAVRAFERGRAARARQDGAHMIVRGKVTANENSMHIVYQKYQASVFAL